MNEKNAINGGVLYLVATPIGNLSDITERAKKTLSEVSFVACEDTRVSGKLLFSLGIKNELFRYERHNAKKAGEQIILRLKSGDSCALVTDAGMPAISDPGEELVRSCIENDIAVTVVPGACAVVSAVALSGMDTRRFVFEGFIEGTESEKKDLLESLKYEKRTVVFYEAPHRLTDTLQMMSDILGDRDCAVCRELTKLNEEVFRGKISAAIKFYDNGNARGEFVIVVKGASDEKSMFWNNMSIEEHVKYYFDNIGLEKMAAIKAVARDRGVSKNEIYKSFVKSTVDKNV